MQMVVNEYPRGYGKEAQDLGLEVSESCFPEFGAGVALKRSR